MKEDVKINNLLSMIMKEYNFIEVDGKYLSETKYDLTQTIQIGWDSTKKRYYLIFEIGRNNERITGFELYNNCFLPIKKQLFNAIIK